MKRIITNKPGLPKITASTRGLKDGYVMISRSVEMDDLRWHTYCVSITREELAKIAKLFPVKSN